MIRDDDRYVRPVEGRMSPRGEICVAGPSVATGYGNDPDATVEAFHDELFHTGDLGYVCLLYTSPSPRDATLSRMPSSA